MTVDIRDARFYVVEEAAGLHKGDAVPLGFDEAFDKAQTLAQRGEPVRVLYTEEASQTELMRFASSGIPTSPVSGA